MNINLELDDFKSDSQAVESLTAFYFASHKEYVSL